MEVIIQLGITILLMLLNGYFVASEFALVSIRRTRVQELIKKRNPRAKQLVAALDNINRYISATQLGITIASLALGWIGEPVVARLIEQTLTFLPRDIALVAGHTIAVALAFILITFFHIVIGELTPKSIALQRTEKTALFIIAPLTLFAKIFSPLVWLLNRAGSIVIRLFGISSSQAPQALHSEEEIKMLLRQSGRSGLIPQREVEIVQNVFLLGDIPVKAVMIPRTEILAFQVGTSLDNVITKIKRYPHSRFPVYDHSVDTIVGFIHIRDVYETVIKKHDHITIAQAHIIRDVITVPEVKKIDATLQEMRRKRVHMAVVSDEFGGTEGIVTLEDIIESIVGEIEDEFDKPIKKIIRQKDGSYLIDGNTTIIDFQEKFKLPLKGQGYTTIGGLVFGILGHEPQVGNEVQVSNLVLHVKEVEGNRIKHLMLRREKSRQKTAQI